MRAHLLLFPHPLVATANEPYATNVKKVEVVPACQKLFVVLVPKTEARLRCLCVV